MFELDKDVDLSKVWENDWVYYGENQYKVESIEETRDGVFEISVNPDWESISHTKDGTSVDDGYDSITAVRRTKRYRDVCNCCGSYSIGQKEMKRD